jgi:hypothetical protein
MFNPKPECFICCTPHGLSEAELRVNPNAWHYPLMTLSQAYGCQCFGLLAHNKCLTKVPTCPTCRRPLPTDTNTLRIKHTYLDPLAALTIRHRTAYRRLGVAILTAMGAGMLADLYAEHHKPWISDTVQFAIQCIRLVVSILLILYLLWNEYMRTRWLTYLMQHDG